MKNELWLAVILPSVFALLGCVTWIAGNLIGDRAGGSSLATQLVTLAAAAWQKEKQDSTVRADKVENITLEEKQ